MNEPTKSEKRLISSARKYLEPVKTVDEQIKSIAKEIVALFLLQSTLFAHQLVY